MPHATHRGTARSHLLLESLLALIVVLSAAGVLISQAAPSSASISPVMHIENHKSGLCARVPYGSTAARTQLDQDSCTSKTNREWRWEPEYGYPQRLVNVHSGLCLTYIGDLHHNGPAQQYPCSATNTHQLWQRQETGWPPQHPSDPYELIVNPASGRCLAPSADSASAYAPLVVTTCVDSDPAQHWASFLSPE